MDSIYVRTVGSTRRASVDIDVFHLLDILEAAEREFTQGYETAPDLQHIKLAQVGDLKRKLMQADKGEYSRQVADFSRCNRCGGVVTPDDLADDGQWLCGPCCEAIDRHLDVSGGREMPSWDAGR